MDTFDQQTEVNYPEVKEELLYYRERAAALSRKNRDLERRLNIEESSHEPDPAEVTHRLECKILAVLCHEDNIGERGTPNYVDPIDIAEETGVRYQDIVKHIQVMARPHLDMVEESTTTEKVRATSADLFERHCEACGIDASAIRRVME